MINRRHLFLSVAASTASTALQAKPCEPEASSPNAAEQQVRSSKPSEGSIEKTESSSKQTDEPPDRIDTNVSLFQWPFRKLPLDEAKKLKLRLNSLGFKQAWAGSFEGIFQRDLRSVNDRLAAICAKDDFYQPFGSVNLNALDWKNDLLRCLTDHQMPGIRLHPNYHGYDLDRDEVNELLEITSKHHSIVQIASAVEDTRTQNQQFSVPDTDLTPLIRKISDHPTAQVQILNYRPRGNIAQKLVSMRQLHFDTARLDGTDGIATWIKQTSPDRILYGSHAPFLIPEATLIRMRESQLAPETQQKLFYSNADNLAAAGRNAS
ncbi:amidohydrolase family protein [bacterium]|nr:amidohydrolase family protein [Rhodopirellula sp.]MDB4676694.1 amidohydrolase family protein [bacterium]MDB4679098.1 amidohydrolase family protein [Rhodopirellula sp.]